MYNIYVIFNTYGISYSILFIDFCLPIYVLLFTIDSRYFKIQSSNTSIPYNIIVYNKFNFNIILLEL